MTADAIVGANDKHNDDDAECFLIVASGDSTLVLTSTNWAGAAKEQ